MSDLLSNPSNEGLVVNSTQIESDTDLVYQAKKVKTTTSDKLKQLRRKFEAQNVASQVEIKSIKVSETSYLHFSISRMFRN